MQQTITRICSRVHRVFCRHTYHTYNYMTFKNGEGQRMETLYGFKCSRCGKEKYIATHGKDGFLSRRQERSLKDGKADDTA